MANKIDRDRRRNFKGSTAFREDEWRLKNQKNLSNFFNYLNNKIDEVNLELVTKWEYEFLVSCLGQLKSGRPLTSKQWLFVDNILKETSK